MQLILLGHLWISRYPPVNTKCYLQHSKGLYIHPPCAWWAVFPNCSSQEPIPLLERPSILYLQYQLLLIWSSYANLITATEPVHLGPAVGPAAVHTELIWDLHKPNGLLQHWMQAWKCLWISCNPMTSVNICQYVEHMWQFQNCHIGTRNCTILKGFKGGIHVKPQE